MFRIELPPLKERKEDIPELVKHLAKSSNELKSETKSIDKSAMSLLVDHDWPGNIRQLENICRYMTVMAPSTSITVDDIPEEVKDLEQNKVAPQLTENPSSTSTWEDSLSNHIKSILSDSNDLSLFSREIEKLLLREALIASKGKRIEAAKY